MVPVALAARHKGGNPSVVSMDDDNLAKMDAEKLRRLPPVFRPADGTITAGNASPLSDGAAALVLVSQRTAESLGLQVCHGGYPPRHHVLAGSPAQRPWL